MNTDFNPRVLAAERLDGGVVVSFEDGRSAIYSARLLSDMFSHAKEITYEELNELDE